MSLIRLDEVSKRFDRRQVLRKVFFRLEKGDRVGLVGNNGSGKTTVLRMILGREEPSEGQIDKENELRIGYFSQFSELSGDVSIEHVLADLLASIKATEDALRQTEDALSRNPGGSQARPPAQGLRIVDGPHGGPGWLDLPASHRHGAE